MPRINGSNLEEHRRRTMNALLDSAETIMREEGDAALTPTNVSRGAGIARNSIYRYVKDMKDLRHQLMARRMPQWIDALEDGLSGITDPAQIVTLWVKINLEQFILQGHDWMTKMPLSDAEFYSSEELWKQHNNTKNENGTETTGGTDDKEQASDERDNAEQWYKDAAATDIFCGHRYDASADQSLEPQQPSLHQRLRAPIVAAWKELHPANPQVGIALTEGVVSNGMRLLSGKEQAKESRSAIISDISRSIRAIVDELREN
ncbi:AcrR family transcriptional regulator [Bifidobacterium commune]|uniref:Transcriptional regulator, TetR family n=1 Tax=Bifidobacterium commune TaxID=1505727 RepID=A0A1C4H5V8_9BIFI|nr:TetR/AcrR family transcriptional regulator [Bifidobacterium commune]MBB2955403.1 AcrR family transcriptional regulator [Bifidobacterium commune]SCC80152.1 transcriptional regulator, TetR family [Bifidobacterium commune]